MILKIASDLFRKYRPSNKALRLICHFWQIFAQSSVLDPIQVAFRFIERNGFKMLPYSIFGIPCVFPESCSLLLESQVDVWTPVLIFRYDIGHIMLANW
jgi:hypothetical protein